MKKTLIISPCYPVNEVTGSCIRTMHFARFFKKLGSVDLAYPHETYGHQAGHSIFSNEYKMGNNDYPNKFAERLCAALKGRPYPIRAYDKTAQKFFFDLVKTNNYDYVLARYIVNTYELLELDQELRQRVILDLDDIYSNSLYESLFYSTNNLARKTLRYLNKILLRKYQEKCLNLNISLFCSEKDRGHSHVGSTKRFVVPNVYSNEIFAKYDFGPGVQNKKNLLFVGMLAYEPNVQGLSWFIETIYPKFKERHPNGQFCIVGHLWNSSDEQIKKLCAGVQDIELVTNAPDIKEFYKKSMAVVVPILTGGGTRIKILEAALARRPVLSTPIGTEGLDMVDGRDLQIFKNAGEFVSKFDEILDQNKYDVMTENAYRTVTQKFSAKNFDDAMIKVVNQIEKQKTSSLKT
jgi:polysaccharide biosynthesis protein PslH